MMRTLISCKYHEDSQTVELLYTDGTLIDIDCMAVEDEAARNMYERSELDYLLYNLARYSLSAFYQASSGFGAKKAVSRSCVSCSLWI